MGYGLEPYSLRCTTGTTATQECGFRFACLRVKQVVKLGILRKALLSRAIVCLLSGCPMKSSILFPSLSSWIRASKLFVAACTGVIFFPFLFWFFVLAASIAFGDDAAIAEALPQLFLCFSLTSMIIGFLFYQVIRFLYWAFLKLFWQHPPKAITPQGFQASLHSYSILLMASLPTAITLIWFGVFYLPEEPVTAYETVRYREMTDFLAVLISWVWLLVAAYLYQWFPFKASKPAKN